jgi:hypothetical protein
LPYLSPNNSIFRFVHHLNPTEYGLSQTAAVGGIQENAMDSGGRKDYPLIKRQCLKIILFIAQISGHQVKNACNQN